MFRKLFTLLLVLGCAQMALAATPTTEVKPQSFTFKYRYQGETLEVRRQAPAWEVAFEQAAQTCFEHYKRHHGTRLTEDQGLDIIDVCANPRS